jgi:CxxC-x17-CxxC domain-containing protein
MRDFDDEGSREPREMHKAICSDCGCECEVPFKPTEGKPVLCQDCFRRKRQEEEF